MTVVVLWMESEELGLWASADTRFLLSEPAVGTFVRTNAATKILALPVRVHGDMRRRPFYESVIGFAFAGDVTPALSTYALASTFLQNLLSVDIYGYCVGRPPEFHEIAECCAKLAARFANETLESTMGRMGKFDAVVFGWCPIANAHMVFWLRPVGDGPVAYDTVRINLVVGGMPFALGNTEAYGDALARVGDSGHPLYGLARKPMHALEDLIDSGQAVDVGGGVSVAWVPPKGQLQLFSRVKPLQRGAPAAAIAFNGFSLDGEQAEVGHCLVAIYGIA